MSLLNPEDAELVLRAKNGNARALEQIVERHLGGVRATVIAILGSHSEIDDIVQDAMLAGLRQLRGLRRPERLAAWLRGIARNLCHRRLRDRRPWQSLERTATVADPRAPNPNDGEDSALTIAVAALPEKLRETLLLFYVEDLSYQQIAERLEITSAAVNRRLTRARDALRLRLGATNPAERRAE